MRTLIIKTTAYKKEDLIILTDINPKKLEEFMQPLILKCRKHEEKTGNFLYNNADLMLEVINEFVNNKIYEVNLDGQIITL